MPSSNCWPYKNDAFSREFGCLICNSAESRRFGLHRWRASNHEPCAEFWQNSASAIWHREPPRPHVSQVFEHPKTKIAVVEPRGQLDDGDPGSGLGVSGLILQLVATHERLFSCILGPVTPLLTSLYAWGFSVAVAEPTDPPGRIEFHQNSTWFTKPRPVTVR